MRNNLPQNLFKILYNYNEDDESRKGFIFVK